VPTRKPSMFRFASLKKMWPVILTLGLIDGASASARFTPSDGGFVVLEKSAHADSGLRSAFLSAARNAPDAGAAARTARELIERARNEREPRFFGYAEAIIQPLLRGVGAANPELLLLQADIQQNRHEFTTAIATLDRAIQAQPHDPRAYLQRAGVRLVRGEFEAARNDCRTLITGGELAIGSVCMAQAAGATGSSERAEAMIRALLSNGQQFDTATRAWAMAALADLERRHAADGDAETLLRQAVEQAPTDDSIRCALADLLLDKAANREVIALTTVNRPSLALLLRTAIAEHRLKDVRAAETSRRFLELIEVDRVRSERAHLREEALYALEVRGDSRAAAVLAVANFKLQRETADIRLLARSASAAGDTAALRNLKRWVVSTGYRDQSIEPILRVTTI